MTRRTGTVSIRHYDHAKEESESRFQDPGINDYPSSAKCGSDDSTSGGEYRALHRIVVSVLVQAVQRFYGQSMNDDGMKNQRHIVSFDGRHIYVDFDSLMQLFKWQNDDLKLGNFFILGFCGFGFLLLFQSALSLTGDFDCINTISPLFDSQRF